MKHLKIYEKWFSEKPKQKKEREFFDSRIDPTQKISIDSFIYTDDYVQEDLMLSSYEQEDQENSDNSKISYPLCKKENLSITHGQTIRCPNCNMKMTNYGNCLTCRINIETLRLYNNYNKFNL